MPMMHIVGKDMTDEETDAAVLAGSRIGVFRQCSIAWHDECSDPDGDECKCICHVEGGAKTAPGPQALANEFTQAHPEAVATAVDAVNRASIVGPYCGRSTWVEGRCALPGCEGSGA